MADFCTYICTIRKRKRRQETDQRVEGVGGGGALNHTLSCLMASESGGGCLGRNDGRP
jgi:hypothetical protein